MDGRSPPPLLLCLCQVSTHIIKKLPGGGCNESVTSWSWRVADYYVPAKDVTMTG